MKVHALAVAAIASSMVFAPVAAQAGTTAASVKSYGQRSTAKVTAKKKAGEELLIGLALAAGTIGVLVATDVIGGGDDDDVRTPGA